MLSLVLRHKPDFIQVDDRAAMAKAAYIAAKRATELESRNEYAHWALGITCWQNGNHEEGIAALEHAIELNPNCSLAYGSLGSALAYVGRTEEAIENQQIAIRSNPKDPSIFYRYSGMALAHYVAGTYQEAVEWAERAIQRMPRFVNVHGMLIASHVALGNMAQARDALAACQVVMPGITIAWFDGFPVRDQTLVEQFVTRLQEAGMP